jgi:starch synthase
VVKRALLEYVGLPRDDADMRRPIVGIVTRLTHQKGCDLFATAADRLMAMDAGWVMLGSGEAWCEDLWRHLAARFPDRVAARIGFDEQLAHLIEAGADLFLMPSRFEPCGLNQMYSQRYGTPPVARATGGLADTIVDGETGVYVPPGDTKALRAAIERLLQDSEERGRLGANAQRWARVHADIAAYVERLAPLVTS